MRATFRRNHTDPTGASLEPNFLEDPLSIHQKVLRHLQQTARKPIASLYDLAGLIVTCCASTFDETQVPDDYQFFDFFENSISIVVSLLCLKAPDTDHLQILGADAGQNEKVTHSLHQFKRSLTARVAEHEELSFTSEIDLVVETEDIKDELHILKAVLDDQRKSMEQLEAFLHQARTKVEHINYKDDSSNLVDYSCIDIQMHRITEMNELAERALSSVRHLIACGMMALHRRLCALMDSDSISP